MKKTEKETPIRYENQEWNLKNQTAKALMEEDTVNSAQRC